MHGPPPIKIVVSERGLRGGHLVAVDEHGDRVADLLADAADPAQGSGPLVRDTQVAFSPDGRWLVFASSRGRLVSESSLWCAPAVVGAMPVRLTVATGSDLQPTFTRDGRSIVFASSRTGNLDLWQLDVAPRADGLALEAVGDARALTTSPEVELMPTTAPDGRIAFAELQSDAAGGTRGRIVELNGATRRPLTEGPADTAPAYSPDGTRLAFSRPTARVPAEDAAATTIDADLWLLDDGSARKVIDQPGTDETSPAWSADGAWIVASSVLRDAAGAAVLSSVVHLEVDATPPVARMLVDRVGALARTSPAVAPVGLDAALLREAPIYADELARILLAALERQGGVPTE